MAGFFGVKVCLLSFIHVAMYSSKTVTITSNSFSQYELQGTATKAINCKILIHFPNETTSLSGIKTSVSCYAYINLLCILLAFLISTMCFYFIKSYVFRVENIFMVLP